MSSNFQRRVSGERILLKPRLFPVHHVHHEEDNVDVSDSIPSSSSSPPSPNIKSPFPAEGRPGPFLLPLASVLPSQTSSQTLKPSSPVSSPSSPSSPSPASPNPSLQSTTTPSKTTAAELSDSRPDGNRAGPPAGSSKSSAPPVVAVLGTLTAIIFLLVLGVFLYRKRSIKKRKRLWNWTDEENNIRVSPYVDYRDYREKSTICEPEPSAAGLKDRWSLPRVVAVKKPSRLPPVDVSPPVVQSLPLPTPIVGAARVIPSDALVYAQVTSTFIPTLPDELSIDVGDALRVLAEFDDGWALCQNAKKEKGMVPSECLDQGDAVSISQGSSLRDEHKSSRISSLSVTPYSGHS